MLLRRLARPLLAIAFISEGVDALRHPDERVQAAAPLADKGQQVLPGDVAAKVPTDPGTLVRVTAVTQVAAGALLALGKAPRIASIALAATVVPSTVTTQDFWAEDDPARKAAKRAAFLKDLGLLGGLLIAAADTEGKPSLGWRGRRSAKKAAAAVSAALPSAAAAESGLGDTVAQRWREAVEQGGELAEQLSARGGDLVDTGRERGGELFEVGRERGGEFAELARKRGEERAELLKQRGGQAGVALRARGVDPAELGELARQRSAEASELAAQRAAELASKAKRRGRVAVKAAKRQAARAAEAVER